MSDSLVLSQREGGVQCITLNRPEALNSFNSALHEALLAALDGAAADATVRAVVLTGAGRAFSAGQDLNDPWVQPAPAGQPPQDMSQVLLRYYRPLMQRLQSMPVPVVAAVNGVAAGAAVSIALGCDLVIAARSASFLQAFSRIGLVPDAGGTWLLPRLVGRGRALGLAMLADKLPAADAEQMGLIWKCVDDSALMPQALALATRLAALPTRALVATRHAMDASQALDLDGAIQLEARLQAQLGGSHDYLEGVAAFAAKRAPNFTDR